MRLEATPALRGRDGERGAIAIVVAAALSVLFGFTALAVDTGLTFQTQRRVQAAADAAVLAGVPDLSSNASTARARAAAIATANGFSSARVTNTATDLRVEIDVPRASIFGRYLGAGSVARTIVAVGRIDPALPALFTGSTSCAGVGMQVNGSGFQIAGDVYSAGKMNFYTGGTNVIGGAVAYNSGAGCTAPTINGGNVDSGGSPIFASATGLRPYPLTYTIADFPVAMCSFGTNFSNGSTLNLATSGPWWQAGSGPSSGTLNTGIICSGAGVNLSGVNITGTITIVAMGPINLSGTTFRLSAANRGLVAYSLSNANCYAAPAAIQAGNFDWIVNGTFFAPNGCANISGSQFTINGSIISSELMLGIGTPARIDSGGGTGGGYRLYQ